MSEIDVQDGKFYHLYGIFFSCTINPFRNGEVRRPITPQHGLAKGKNPSAGLPKGSRPDSAGNDSTALKKKAKGATLKVQSTASSMSIAPSEVSDSNSNANGQKRQARKTTSVAKNPTAEKPKGSKVLDTDTPLHQPDKGNRMNAGPTEGGEPI